MIDSLSNSKGELIERSSWALARARRARGRVPLATGQALAGAAAKKSARQATSSSLHQEEGR